MHAAWTLNFTNHSWNSIWSHGLISGPGSGRHLRKYLNSPNTARVQTVTVGGGQLTDHRKRWENDDSRALDRPTAKTSDVLTNSRSSMCQNWARRHRKAHHNSRECGRVIDWTPGGKEDRIKRESWCTSKRTYDNTMHILSILEQWTYCSQRALPNAQGPCYHTRPRINLIAWIASYIPNMHHNVLYYVMKHDAYDNQNFGCVPFT